ncbi:hypothetical protein [Pseudofrankia sp. BMG5.37]|uniref:hypothetical protein n=1 Tax=Pseudofrankia sp. BMG5.37 TaxID=3050035 RepID=UPI0028940C40|nr:hypothetical protein [Pseudofrankia sp. BMG5.37]MDT3445597.1 hypothetical protein [Pseudofrankia sp. BMG5.37]
MDQINETVLVEKFSVLLPHLDERQRRPLAIAYKKPKGGTLTDEQRAHVLVVILHAEHRRNT